MALARAFRAGASANAVGVGFLGGSCGHCKRCRGGDLVHCENQEFTGVQHDGGYAEVMTAKATGLVFVPDDLSSVDAAPLLCAGITTFGGIRSTSAKAGDLVAILGIGGLGHLAIQYARHMGFEVVAIGRGKDKAELAKKLGAHHYIDSKEGSFGDALQAMGGAAFVVSTASDGTALTEAVKGPSPELLPRLIPCRRSRRPVHPAQGRRHGAPRADGSRHLLPLQGGLPLLQHSARRRALDQCCVEL